MNDSQKKKRNFRASKKWKEFRHEKYIEQNGRCPICNMKLGKTSNLHHIDLNEAHYEDLSDPTHFIFLCNTCHDYCHYKYKAYLRGDFNFDELKNLWDKMFEISDGTK